MRYVIHEHYATTHHFDLRLERDGVLRSWAVPKGLPTDSRANRLAVEVDDHALDHIDFEDLTPVPGSGDAVRKSIWDSGTYEVIRETDDKLVFELSGTRVTDRFALFRTDGSNWMIHLMTD